MDVFKKLRDEIDLAELAGRFTDLQPSGKSLKGRCPHPDHEDKEPSFYVYPDGHFHCYGCRWRGDVTDLCAGVKGLEPGYAAALDLAREHGGHLPEQDPEVRRIAEEHRTREAECLKRAGECHAALAQHPDTARWWEAQGFGEELRGRFMLGADEDGEAATIPFWSRGRVLGVIRRKLEGEPKYRLPKKEAFPGEHRPLFVPGRIGDETFLVEGYLDALALAAFGYGAVAIGGTHANEHQLEELRNIPGTIYILPDADDAGIEAGRRWARELYPKTMLCEPDYEKEADDGHKD